MHLLVVHHESVYFAGAEKMLGYFLEGLISSDIEVAVAATRGSRVVGVIPATYRIIELPENRKFSMRQFLRQVAVIRASARQGRFDLIHAWAARDWELAGTVGALLGAPVVGTLHDHPQASFISPARRRLMAFCARALLRRIICVSEAVSQACLVSGYPAQKLTVIHNGLPLSEGAAPSDPGPALRLGFLGAFSPRKGLRDLFKILDQIASSASAPWLMRIAGAVQDRESEQLLEQIGGEFGARSWWGRVEWLGWVGNPAHFFEQIDLLICPSSDFDPFPTVLLEAAQHARPVVASRIGGVPEIVVDGRTGWLFEPGRIAEAASIVGRLMKEPGAVRRAGAAARQRLETHFDRAKMVAQHEQLYSTMVKHV